MAEFTVSFTNHLPENHEYPISELLGTVEKQYTDLYNRYIEICNKYPKPEKIYIGPEYYISSLSRKEHDANCAFREKHYKSCHNPGHYIYDIAGTGFGAVTKLKCPICGEVEDITDDDCW